MSIHPATHMLRVSLAVRDLQRALGYYQEIIGLELLEQESGQARLGVGETHLLTLLEQPDGRRTPSAPGLYHFALLLPDRAALGSVLRHLAAEQVPLGMSDHGVSEALYLNDPDGNGIELYRDRTREQWPRSATGDLLLTNAPLDVAAIMAEGGSWSGLPAGTTLGHMHLQVNDIAQAEAFYVDLLGFELIARWGESARFVGAGGYHHHLGLNTWHSAGSAPAPQPALGLHSFEIGIPLDGWRELHARLEAAGRDMAIERERPLSHHKRTLALQDPSGNQLLINAT